MKNLLIITGIFLVALIAAPFVVNGWITVSERNHAFGRELEHEQQEVQKARQMAEAGLRQQIQLDLDKMADEYLADPSGYMERHNVDASTFRKSALRQYARERYEAIEPKPHLPFDQLYK